MNTNSNNNINVNNTSVENTSVEDSNTSSFSFENDDKFACDDNISNLSSSVAPAKWYGTLAHPLSHPLTSPIFNPLL